MTKTRDDFHALVDAVRTLQDCIRSMGANAQVAEIRLKPTRGSAGRFEVERAIKASPSYAQQMIFPAEQRLPPNCIAEIAGVKLTEVPV